MSWLLALALPLVALVLTVAVVALLLRLTGGTALMIERPTQTETKETTR
nr:hypothetical protein [Nocardiopsis sp. 90127]